MLHRYAVSAALIIAGVSAASIYVAKLCPDQTCSDQEYPILDYDEESGECMCKRHPCWTEAAASEAKLCEDPDYPHLAFHYDAERKLKCRCTAVMHFASPYVAEQLCPGFECEDSRPHLDWDEEAAAGEQCSCKEHPCENDNGTFHECKDLAYPHLTFYYDPSGNLQCQCTSELHYGIPGVGREACPRRFCDKGHPILDWDKEDLRCVCRTQPCHNETDAAGNEVTRCPGTIKPPTKSAMNPYLWDMKQKTDEL